MENKLLSLFFLVYFVITILLFYICIYNHNQIKKSRLCRHSKLCRKIYSRISRKLLKMLPQYLVVYAPNKMLIAKLNHFISAKGQAKNIV